MGAIVVIVEMLGVGNLPTEGQIERRKEAAERNMKKRAETRLQKELEAEKQRLWEKLRMTDEEIAEEMKTWDRERRKYEAKLISAGVKAGTVYRRELKTETYGWPVTVIEEKRWKNPDKISMDDWKKQKA